MRWYFYENMGHGPGWLMVLIFWFLVVCGIIFLIKTLFGRRAGNERDSAEQILRRRFAEGEIDKDEFEQRMQVLMKK